VNRNELVERLAEEHDPTRRQSRELGESVFGMITEAAGKGEEVALFGFGWFKVADCAAHKGRNPQTGEAVNIAASKTLKFAPAKSLKASLGTKRRSRKGT
jgi:DNA-binding protein HU-beta